METPTKTSPGGNCSAAGAPEDRRGFFAQAATLVLGGVAFLVPAVTGIVAFLNPLGQKSRAGRFLRVTTLDVLPEDGTPRRFPVIADRTDAWNHYPEEPIGAVYLRRTGDRKKPVEALHTRCPHAGCPIQFRATSKGGEFFCPCHTNPRFDLSGKRLEIPSDSPRRMDSLDVDPELLQNGEIWVKFQNFRTGTSRPVERT